MGVEGCTKCIKYLLFFFNFIFWLAGCLILGGSLWLRYDEQTGSLLNAQFENATPPKTFYISIYALIAVGAVMMFVGFLGCYGAIQESQCLLGTFFACLVILFACGAAAGIWGFINKDKITEEATNFYDTIYDSAKGNNEAAKKVLQGIQEALKCCGKGTGFVDTVNDAFQSQCLFGNTKCHNRIYDLFNNNIYIIGIAALIAAVIMIFEMIFSMVLCCGIRNSPVY